MKLISDVTTTTDEPNVLLNVTAVVEYDPRGADSLGAFSVTGHTVVEMATISVVT